jgi:thymidylate synthase
MNTLSLQGDHIGKVWFDLLGNLEVLGDAVSPRGQDTKERRAVKLVVEDARNNVFFSQRRGLQYRFMIAEWLWIWYGLDDVKTMARYNPKIGPMASDDGLTFAGAYGPRIKQQWFNMINGLWMDRDSRQSVIQIYQPPAQPTKDVPCTLSMQFFNRGGVLETVVNMRSSDVWLGLPYDFFNFSMLANIAAAQLELDLGPLVMHLGSSHLYLRDRDKALAVLNNPASLQYFRSPQVEAEPPWWLKQVLQDDPDARPPAEFEVLHEPWWTYAQVLNAENNIAAFELLKGAMLPWRQG